MRIPPWSRSSIGRRNTTADGKPVVSITHVGIVRPESDHRLPAILVAGKQIFATHYLEGGLDMLRGFFGAFVRGVLKDRVERQAPLIVRGLRARLESGNPPDEISDPFAKGRPGVR